MRFEKNKNCDYKDPKACLFNLQSYHHFPARYPEKVALQLSDGAQKIIRFYDGENLIDLEIWYDNKYGTGARALYGRG